MSDRNIIFISKATPEDDEFVLWLAPKLEAAGYLVFADILSLKAGGRWRKEVTSALQERAIKMLLCCSDESLSKDGVQEEIGIGLDLAKELNDSKFIIPLRLEKFKKVFGIGEIQYINFVGSWANGLSSLLDELSEENIPKAEEKHVIHPNWELYKQRFSIEVITEEETLTSNWVKIQSFPEKIHFFKPKGVIDFGKLKQACASSPYPIEVYMNGFFTFMDVEEVNEYFSQFGMGSFKKKGSFLVEKFIDRGLKEPKIYSREAGNLITSMFRQSWNQACRDKNLTEYAYSNQLGFHVNNEVVSVGKKVPWGEVKDRRSSMLRNISKGKVWEYGVTASPSFWPFPHFKFKSRILFSDIAGKDVGDIINDVQVQHKLRRRVCSAWRNKAWHGRLMAFMKILSEDEQQLYLPVSSELGISLSNVPLTVTSPVTTKLPDMLNEDEDESDPTTLGYFELEDSIE